jgi:hypothetical protein
MNIPSSKKITDLMMYMGLSQHIFSQGCECPSTEGIFKFDEIQNLNEVILNFLMIEYTEISNLFECHLINILKKCLQKFGGWSVVKF